MKEHKDWYKIRSVKPEVKKAIKEYCFKYGITHAKFLEKDKRIKPFIDFSTSEL